MNGNAERDEGWQMPVTPSTAAYTTNQAHGGGRSIRIGITGGSNILSYSSARQLVTLPATALSASVNFWLYPVSTSTQMAPPAQADTLPSIVQEVGADSVSLAPADGDAQYVLIMDESFNVLETLLWTLDNSAAWQAYTFDLSDYIGQTIWLHFGVYNDGVGGVTGLYLDDASLTACEPPPPDFDEQVFLPVVRKDGVYIYHRT